MRKKFKKMLGLSLSALMMGTVALPSATYIVHAESISTKIQALLFLMEMKFLQIHQLMFHLRILIQTLEQIVALILVMKMALKNAQITY